MLDSTLTYVLRSFAGVMFDPGRGFKFEFVESKDSKDLVFSVFVYYRGVHRVTLSFLVRHGKLHCNSAFAITKGVDMNKDYEDVSAVERFFGPLLKNDIDMPLDMFFRVFKAYLRGLAKLFV